VLYVCIATRDNAATVGPLLWKLRKVFQEFSREYHILVADDGSTDGAGETLEAYQRALPLTLVRHDPPIGLAASLEGLFRDALERSDRPRRDCVATLPADFSFSPAVLPDLLRRFESGADVIVGESAFEGQPFGWRLVARSAPWLLRPGISLPGLRDLLSGVTLIRLITLKSCLKDDAGALLRTDGLPARAELVARVASTARQIASVPIVPHEPGESQFGTARPLGVALSLFRAGRAVSIPRPAVQVEH
jgi:glycosyltransferase involved in cell wall biosynthesis